MWSRQSWQLREKSNCASRIWKSAKLHLQSPQTIFMSYCVCQEGHLSAHVLRDLALHSHNTPHTAPQSPENHSQDPSSCIVPTNTSHPPTNKSLSRKQMPETMQVAAKSFQLPWRACCCSNVASLPHYPSDPRVLRFQI